MGRVRCDDRGGQTVSEFPIMLAATFGCEDAIRSLGRPAAECLWLNHGGPVLTVATEFELTPAFAMMAGRDRCERLLLA